MEDLRILLYTDSESDADEDPEKRARRGDSESDMEATEEVFSGKEISPRVIAISALRIMNDLVARGSMLQVTKE